MAVNGFQGKFRILIAHWSANERMRKLKTGPFVHERRPATLPQTFFAFSNV